MALSHTRLGIIITYIVIGVTGAKPCMKSEEQIGIITTFCL